jgi:putative peptidoglycan lipid II flippase
MVQEQTAARTARVARSTIVVMAGLAGSIAFGLIRQRVVAVQFGTSAAMDAYAAANNIPELLFTILAGGALAFAYIPVYTGLMDKGPREQADRLVSNVFNSVILLISIAAVLVALIAPALVTSAWGIAPNFPPEVQQLTIELMRILLLSTIIFAASSILTGTLHAHQHFILPALSPSLYSAGIIFGALALAPAMGIFGLAWGAVIGACLHLLVQVPGIVRKKIRWSLSLGWTNPHLHRVVILMAPRILDLWLARASITWLNSNLASGLGEGRVSSLQFALQLMNTPWTLIGTAIGIAVFPTMAALAARTDITGLRGSLSGSIRAILTLSLPAAVGLIVLGRPVIQVLFEGGEFTADSTDLVYFALQFFALALISQSILEVVVRAFAAQQDTLTPLLVSLFTTALNIGLAIYLSRPLGEGGLEHGGLALANGVAVGIEAAIGLAILHVRWRGVDGRRILTDAAKAALAALLMGLSIVFYNRIIAPAPFLHLLGGAVIGGAVYFGSAYLLGIDEIRTVPLAVLNSFRKSPTT